MKTIIVPTDFSANALYAAYYAADMAAMLGYRLNLLHVYTIPAPVTELPLAYDTSQVEADARQNLTTLSDKLTARTSGRVTIHIDVRQGDIMTEIENYCNIAKPFAVVMGAESTAGFQRLLAGAKTLAALRKMQWPLIIVPPFNMFNNIRKIGFACDFRDVIESVRVKEIRELVREFGAELHIIYVKDEPGSSFDNETIMESGELQEMLGDLKPKYHFINNPNIAAGINDYTKNNTLDLLILVPKKHNVIHRVTSPSYSKQVVLHANVPILSLHE